MSVSTVGTEDRLERFRELAIEFRAAAEQGDASALGRILAERGHLITDFGRAAAPRNQREREARARVLESILEIDRGTEEILRHRRDEIGAELVALDSGRRGLTGYGAGGRSAGKRIDERG